jgi:hypothetical protein
MSTTSPEPNSRAGQFGRPGCRHGIHDGLGIRRSAVGDVMADVTMTTTAETLFPGHPRDVAIDRQLLSFRFLFGTGDMSHIPSRHCLVGTYAFQRYRSMRSAEAM